MKPYVRALCQNTNHMSPHNLTQHLHPDGGDICYLTYPMPPEVVSLPTPTTEEEAETTMRLYEKSAADRPGQIMLPIETQSGHQILFSREYGITFCFGIEDYSTYTDPYRDEYIHTFEKDGDTFVSLLRHTFATSLYAMALEIWAATYEGAVPKRVMIHVDSRPDVEARIDNREPELIAPFFEIREEALTTPPQVQFERMKVKIRGPVDQLEEIEEALQAYQKEQKGQK